MWTRVVDGRALTFHLAGINNQNFLMRDDETGTFWQQINGRAVSGPLAGKQLTLVASDELSFSLWRAEHALGLVLRDVDRYASEYEKKDWESRIAKMRTVVDTKATGIAPRELMLGIEVNGAARAYPLQRVLDQKLVLDTLGGVPLMIVVGADRQSIRCFRRPSHEVEFYRRDGASALLMDSANGGEWSFQGCAVAGTSRGTCLQRIDVLKDYWFDWHLYHPATSVYTR